MEEQRKNPNKKLRSGERHVRQNLDTIEWNHKWRYCKALNYIKAEDTVLDFGIGCGFGSFILSILAKQVIGIDDSEEAIHYAQQCWSKSNIKFIKSCIFDFQEKVDVITAFEVIEHIKDYKQMFGKFKELNPKHIIITTPHDSYAISNTFHWRHYSIEDVTKLLDEIGYNVVESELRKFKKMAIYVVGKRREE